MKSDKYGNNIQQIEERLLNSNSLRCMFAIRECVLENIDNRRIVEILQELKSSKLIEWNSCRISDCAVAALHLLNIEKYNGDDERVKVLIDTVFFTKLNESNN